MLNALLPRLLVLVLLPTAARLCSAPAATSAAAPGPIVATDLLKLKSVESPALSPDGQWAAYVVRSIEPKPVDPAAKDAPREDWTYHTHLWLVATDGQTPPRQLTRGSNANSAPAWHPDGRRLAFVRTVEKEKPQIYVLSLDGGEAQAVTKLATGATDPRWSPDGRKLLVSSALSDAQVRDLLETQGAAALPLWSPERGNRIPNDTANWKLKSAGKGAKNDGDNAVELSAAKPDGTLAERREWLARNEADANPRVTTRTNFLAEGDLQPDFAFAQLYLVTIGDHPEPPKPLAPGYEAKTDAEWLADSRHIVYVAPRNATEHPDRERLRSLALLDTETGGTRTMLARPDESYGNPTPSPDGKWIACTVQIGGPFSFDQPKVAVVPTEGGDLRVLSGSLDRSAQNLKWTPNSSALYFTAPSQGRFPLYRVGLDRAEVQTLTEPSDWGIRAFDLGTDRLVQVVTQPGNPSELHVAHLSAKVSQPLTTHNTAWLAGKKLSPYQAGRFTTKDGRDIEYWIIKPTEFDAARKYPLLVQIHGGPSAMWGPGEESMWFEFQYYAARGFGIVFSNPRGSGGYGRDFQRANFRDWGRGPGSDVLQAASFAAKESWVDPERQVLTGGSYGGYLTAWIVAHDHRFKAAVAQRGVYDLVTFLGEGTAWFLVPLYWGGYPWQQEIRGLLQRESPLTYVEQIKTPLLIQHGDVDFRTGVIQSQMLYKSLKLLGRPVEYVRYPRATHEMSRSGEPRQRLDSLIRYEEFFRRYVGEN